MAQKKFKNTKTVKSIRNSPKKARDAAYTGLDNPKKVATATVGGLVGGQLGGVVGGLWGDAGTLAGFSYGTYKGTKAGWNHNNKRNAKTGVRGSSPAQLKAGNRTKRK